jgi:LuxR family transcriptional regulator, maltose regulon positive regulatory protein
MKLPGACLRIAYVQYASGMPDKRPVAKLVAPRTDELVRRRRVSSAIERGLRSGACWIAAPAGYGKTTALADYLDQKAGRHIWYRVDQGDQDIAGFFHYLRLALRTASARRAVPVFGAEYTDEPEAFARRFFRAWFARLAPGTLLVLDDLHRADVPQFRALLAMLLHELPAGIQCALVSRTLPGKELTELRLQGRLAVVDQATLKFSEREARALVRARVKRAAAAINVSAARGWAAGLVLLAERASAGDVHTELLRKHTAHLEAGVFATLAGQFFDTLPRAQRDALLKLSLLPEVRPDVARALADAAGADDLLETLQQRQLLITRGDTSDAVFHVHDLLREFLQERIQQELSAGDLTRVREHAATLLHAAGHADAATTLALQARSWQLAHRFIAAQAEALLEQGRRATLIERCAALPPDQIDGWLSYWLGVANMSEDATAEAWFARAWEQFTAASELRGQYLTAARAVIAKADSWRTHDGLATWTERMIGLIEREPPSLTHDEQLLVWTGMLRAADFAPDYRSNRPAVNRLARLLLERLARPLPGDSTTLRLMASATLIDHSGSTGHQAIFEQAVDNVRHDLREATVLPWALGMWLVTFGAVTGRYFSYVRRGFPYASPDEALRAAIAIGEREALRGVEFGALYHLQLQMKSRNDLSGFATLVRRLAEIADSRYTTQVAVVADCQAALHTLQGNLAAAYRACARFMAAIEAANEPPIERWPHFITRFQVLLADRKPVAAAEFLSELLPLFDGGLRQRTLACMYVARAFAAKWSNSGEYAQRLRECVEQMHLASWPAILLNLPELLAELCADALEQGIEPEFCRALIQRRALHPPASRPASWPWILRVRVLGEFRLERAESPVDFGVKPPTRSLDIVRILAVSRGHTCSLQQIYEYLWPDADGDQAKAACEQALHRLRKLLGQADLIVQREGKLRFASEKVWVDLEDWEARLARASRQEAAADIEAVFRSFPGPLLPDESSTAWALPAVERVRSKLVDLALLLGGRLAASADPSALSVYLRTLDMYPTSERCYEALLRARLARGDRSAALEDYRRYERILKSSLQTKPSLAIRALLKHEID